MIIPVYKPVGASSHALAHKVGLHFAQKATHTGTLDPMAEGVLVVLTGEDRFKKATIDFGLKEYEFSFCVGITTDTGDLLGKIIGYVTKMYNTSEIQKKIAQVFPTLIGPQKQTQPLFSSQRVQGVSGFDLAAQNKSFKQKVNEITISSLTVNTTVVQTVSEVCAAAAKKRATVTGNFRQKQITKDWRQLEVTLKKSAISELLICDCTVVTTKRTYVRALVQSIGASLHLPCVTTAICRTKNGTFTLQEAQKQSALLFPDADLL